MTRFSVGVEFFIEADTAEDAQILVGETVGANLPDAIDDFIVQEAEVAE